MKHVLGAAPAAFLSGAVALGAIGCAGGLTGTADSDRLESLLAAPGEGCGTRFVQGDFDGDGASDYACLYDLGSARSVMLVMRGTASGPTEEAWWRGPDGGFAAERCGDRFASGDFSGDGKSDLVCLYDHGDGSQEITAFVSTGSGFERSSWYRRRGDAVESSSAVQEQSGAAYESSACGAHFVAGDFDGDRKSDLACVDDADRGSGAVVTFLSTGSSFARATWHQGGEGSLEWSRCGDRVVAADFSGDGMSDLACLLDRGELPHEVFVLESAATRFELATWHRSSELDASLCGSRFVAGDFNGDAKADLACLLDDGGAARVVVFRSDSKRFELETWLAERSPDFEARRCDGRLAVGRLDDDELDDLACMYDAGTGTGHPQGRAALSRLLAFLSTGTELGRAAAWPRIEAGLAPLDASHCTGRLFIGRTPSPWAEGALRGDITCGIDYGPLGVGVRHHLLNPSSLELELPIRAIGDPLDAAHGPAAFSPRRLAACRAVPTVVYDQPTLDYADVEYRMARREGDALVLTGAHRPSAPFVVWLRDSPTEMVHGEAGYSDGLRFEEAFTALAQAHPGMIRMVSIDEPYWFYPPTYQDKDRIRTGHAPLRDVLVDAAKTIHSHGIPVWVNFSKPELELMSEEPPVPLNSPWFDVVSVDWYHYGTDLLGPADVGAWFDGEIEPLLDALHERRVPVAWGAEYAGQRQHEIVVVDGFVFQPWNAAEIQNVNDLFYEYSEWARAVNAGQSDPPVLLQAPYAWSEHTVYNGLSVVPRLRRYWQDFNELPLCP